jgi:hypothetical protein
MINEYASVGGIRIDEVFGESQPQCLFVRHKSNIT